MQAVPKETMTIVVPVKDRATLVLRTLDSIRRQSWRPLKVIVIDNGSSDGTPESVEAWIAKNSAPGFEVSLEREPVPGPSAARNCGLEAVDTRLMMFFDSDDIMLPDHVERVMERFYAGDEPDLVCYRVNYHPINGADTITHSAGSDKMTAHICHALLRTQGYACETALMRRSGGWDVSLFCWEDLEIGTRLLMEARHKVYIDHIGVDVYARADSVTGTEFSSRRGEWERALDRIERNFENSRHKDRKKWLRLLSYKRAILAAQYKREGHKEAAVNLMKRALGNPLLNPLQRWYVRGSYLLASAGVRGTAFLANLIL